MIIVWGSIEAIPGEIETVMKLSLEHVHRSRSEPGCISHSVQIDVENQNRLIFFEEWEDMPALQAHFTIAESKTFIATMTKLTAHPPSMKIFDSTLIS